MLCFRTNSSSCLARSNASGASSASMMRADIPGTRVASSFRCAKMASAVPMQSFSFRALISPMPGIMPSAIVASSSFSFMEVRGKGFIENAAVAQSSVYHTHAFNGSLDNYFHVGQAENVLVEYILDAFLFQIKF